MTEFFEKHSGKFIASVILGVVAAIIGLIVLFNCVDEVDNYELGYQYDRRSGQVTVLRRTGYFVTPPLVVSVHTVDLRPMRVCISGGTVSGTHDPSNINSRVLNCKLVRFNPAGLSVFLSWHGRKDYGFDELMPLLRNYAYDGASRSYPFLTVLRELRAEPEPGTITAAPPAPALPTPAVPAPTPTSNAPATASDAGASQ